MAAMPPTIPDPIPFDRLLSLEGRCAVVTGGSRGIGEAIALRLAEAGASVVATARGREGLEKVEAKVIAMGGRAAGVQANAGSVEDARRVIDLAMSRFGSVDILVNNAAVFPALLSIEMTEALWDEIVDADLKGPFFLSKLAAAEMIKAGRGGRIVNIISTEVLRPTGMLVAYGAAKAGLMAVTRSMAKELGEHGVLVNAVIPGATLTAERIAALKSGRMIEGPFQAAPPEAVKTRQKQRDLLEKGALGKMLTTMPLRRPGFPDDLAKAVLFLASDLASYVSGTLLLVDGAQTLR
jgi:NAD(P)-dependent dehydrogenase (short-subunit alcohol dehydrogenase family)